jgi:hypothetical protein
VALSIVIGIIFGVFHYALFRIAPTAFLGVILTGIAIVTGSILPGMLYHTLNNAYAVWLGTNSISFEQAGRPTQFAAVIVFALALWIIYRASLPRVGNTIDRSGTIVGNQ